MSDDRTNRTKKGLAAMVMAGLSVVGLSGAAVAQSDPVPSSPPAQVTLAPGSTDGGKSQMVADATGAESDTQDPTLNGSVKAPSDGEGMSEESEAKALEALATISPAQAQAAAEAEVPGTVLQVELDNENGSVVYSVEIADGRGGHVDVKVDAGNGTVLHRDADTD